MLAPVLLGATKPEAKRSDFAERVDVVEVEVPVEVVDRDGKPVRGLGAENFRVFDEGDARSILRFQVVDLEVTQPSSAPASAAIAAPATTARRHLLLLFDLTFAKPLSISRARRAAREFVLNGLHPDDLAAVAIYSVEYGPRLLVTFTPDRAQLARALDSLSFDHRFDDLASADPLRFMVPFARTEVPTSVSTRADDGRGIREEIQQVSAESQSIIAETVEREQKQYERARVSQWTRELGELARMLDSVKGRKQVILFSEGFDSRLVVGRSDPGESEAAFENQAATFGEIWRVDSDSRFGSTRLQGESDRLVQELKRADCVVHAVDIGGLRAGNDLGSSGRNPGEESLFFLANETGGQLFKDANDLAGQLGRVLSRTSVTYLLTFAARDLKMDGAYRRLRVELDGVKGGRVSHRSGYYAPRPFEELDPFERNLLAADAIATARPRDELDVQVLAAAFRTGVELAYVPVILEVGGEALVRDRPPGRIETEIYAYATDERGEMRDFFSRTLALDVDPADPAFARGGLKYYGHLDLPRGRYLLRVLVRDATSGRSGLAAVSVDVPEFGETQATLLPPFVVDESNRWVLVRERGQSGSSGSIVYPFTVGGEPYVPSAIGELSGGADARFCLVGYNLPATELGAEIELLDDSGQRVGGGPVAIARSTTGIAGLGKWTASLRAPDVPPGRYRLRVVLSDAAGLRFENQSWVRVAG